MPEDSSKLQSTTSQAPVQTPASKPEDAGQVSGLEEHVVGPDMPNPTPPSQETPPPSNTVSPTDAVSPPASFESASASGRTSPLKTIGLVVLAIVVIGGLSAAGYYLGVNKVLIPQGSPTPEAKETIKPSPTATPNPIADWKGYSDTKYGYSIKYPQDQFSRIICPGKEKDKFMLTQKSDMDPIEAETCARDGFYSLELTADSAKFDEPVDGDYEVVTKNTTIDGVSAKQYTLTKKEPGQGPGWYSVVLVTKGKINYQFIYDNNCGGLEGDKQMVCINTFTQILSTFTFVEPTPTPSAKDQ